MSISKPKISNPTTKFIDFKSEEVKFVFWNKEEEKNEEIKMPFYFVVLDELSTISGFCDKTQCGIFANEVHRISDEILRVRTFKGGESVTGLYKDISDEIKVLGGRFTKSVYAMLVSENGNELVNIKFRGAAFSSWLDKKINPEQYTIGIVGVREKQKGKVTYNVPIFKAFKLDTERLNEAVKLDVLLQEYLKEYKNQVIEKQESVAETPVEKTDFLPQRPDSYTKAVNNDVSDIDDLPF